MKDIEKKFKVEDKEYTLVVNLNVYQAIQSKFGTLKRFGDLTGAKEPNLEAMIFAYTEMLNEAIDINNEKTGENVPFFTSKQTGRLITKYGLENSGMTLNSAIIEASGNTEKN